MSIIYNNDLPDQEQFFALFNSTGWNEVYQLTAAELYGALENSWYLVAAYSQERLVGFGRLLCDGIAHAFILDLIVLPEYQGRGIGGHILSQLKEKCAAHNVRDVQLFCATGKAGFYEKQGFVARPADAPGMGLKRS